MRKNTWSRSTDRAGRKEASQLRAEIIDGINEVKPSAWNNLQGTDYPFLRHEFLAALETAACVGPGTGWHPCHAVLYDAEENLIGAMPLYQKTNSWGEFVFDFAWADAYRQAGLRYYPKLVSAVPYTPATSPRLLLAPGCDPTAVLSKLIDAARQLATRLRLSSLHLLFPTEQQAKQLAGQDLLIRKDCQFHWHNRDYESFEDFLGELTSQKRKKLRRERRRIAESGISFRIMHGDELNDDVWEQIMPLYASSFWRRGREPYLNQKFFAAISRELPEQIVVFVAMHSDEPIATAICFRSADTLYGRYWGSSARYHSLHFETCYYQGIDYCIANGLAHFEPGTQGEHKIARGFVPTETWSAHWLSHPQFAAAIDDYLNRERAYIDEYMDAVQEHVPYRKTAD
ncbi:MAG: GNAT family N-acetyltransferase [Gammaproteobacteria bacterium]|nr:GNAT family N-acetyltransferase [Gammaproteobacteria bacterium]